jgi:selenocysteine lyase/cysteine desulfurase
MDLMDEVGIAWTERHVEGLTSRLIEGLDRVGAQVVTPRDVSRRGPLIAVATTDAPKMVANLAEEGILTSPRDGNIRLSWHCYNSAQDVEAVVAGLERHSDLLAR